MANERLYQFPSKASPVPADIIYSGDSAAAFNEVNITIAALIGAYPNLLGIGGLTLGANSYAYVNNSSAYTAGTITALAVSLLADSTIATMQTTLGYTATPTATLFAGWDSHKNLSANNNITAYATTATAAATTTLTVGSAFQQFFTGSTTQTVLMPVTSTLVLGQAYYIVNNSSGAVTVQSSGGNNIQVMAANTTLLVTCILTSGTTAASWYADYNFQTALTLPLSIANGGTGVGSVTTSPTASAWAAWDANSNLSANNFNPAYATTATAAATTTLVVGSAYYQFFTGTTTQTVLMPVTSTLTQGQSFYIVNNSTGVVTVQSSGANNIIAMAANTTALLTCISTSGTTAASWNADYAQSGLSLPVSLANGGTGQSLSAVNSAVFSTTSGGAAQLSTTLPPALNVPQPNIVGVTTNSNAAAGSVGEFVFSVITAASAVTATNNVATDVTSISLTAGDWDVWGNIWWPNVGTTASNLEAWTSATSATTPDGSLRSGLNLATNSIIAASGVVAPSARYSLSTTTTIYLTGFLSSNVGNGTQCGGIYARRVR
jgi:hypothetical protein